VNKLFVGIANAAEAGHHAPVATIFGIEISSYTTSMWLVMALLIGVSFLATRDLKWFASGLQNFLELVVEKLLNFLSEVMGEEKARKYFPYLATVFIFILVMNYCSLLPGSGTISWLTTPTSTLSVTVGLALCTFSVTHFFGIKEKGLSYFKHFFQPYPFLFPLNIVEEIVKPLSLSLRLFGNIFGEKMIGMTLFSMIPLIVPLPAYFLGILFGAIQAYVFTLLSAIYIHTATDGHH